MQWIERYELVSPHPMFPLCRPDRVPDRIAWMNITRDSGWVLEAVICGHTWPTPDQPGTAPRTSYPTQAGRKVGIQVGRTQGNISRFWHEGSRPMDGWMASTADGHAYHLRGPTGRLYPRRRKDQEPARTWDLGLRSSGSAGHTPGWEKVGCIGKRICQSREKPRGDQSIMPTAQETLGKGTAQSGWCSAPGNSQPSRARGECGSAPECRGKPA